MHEDPSNFSVVCYQTGSINVGISKLTDDEEVLSEKRVSSSTLAAFTGCSTRSTTR
ncbi:MAG: hypothetical protein ACR2KT_04755 [Methylocella sp.]